LKTYGLPRNVVAEIKGLIASDKPSPHPPSALVRVLKLLCERRNYARAGLFLVINGREVPRAFGGAQVPAGQSLPEFSVPIKIASHTLGSLRVQLAAGRSFSPEERVLLHEAADVLALYLSGKGRYLVRKTREALRESTALNSGETRGYHPASDKGNVGTLRAVAGEKARS